MQKRKSLEANTSCSGENRIFTKTFLLYRYDFKAKWDGRTDKGEITKKNIDITKFLMVLSSRLRISYVRFKLKDINDRFCDFNLQNDCYKKNINKYVDHTRRLWRQTDEN